MKINNVEANVISKVDYAKETQKKTVARIEAGKDNEVSDKVEISRDMSSGNVLTYEELQCAIENIASSQSSIMSVEEAGEMIRKANENILRNASESVLAQANQTQTSVNELTK